MSFFNIPNIKLAGIAAAVPKNLESNLEYDWLSKSEQNLLIKTTGIEERRIVNDGKTTSDFCEAATLKLLDELNWKKEEIGILIFVSQSRDYFLPATSIILQNKLGLPISTIALDISLGCSGYVYGLSTIASMMSAANIKKGLLLVGDVSSFSLNKKDKSTYPLFGDAGTATAIELADSQLGMSFQLNSDGKDHQTIIIPDGGVRNPLTDESFIEKEIEKGIWRSNRNLKLDGLGVFNFSITKVHPQIKELIEKTNLEISEIDYYVFHQANKLILDTIRKKLKIDQNKVPLSLNKYGNTSSASIPLTIVTELAKELKSENKLSLLSGFGVGLSWGSVILELNDLVCPNLIEL